MADTAISGLADATAITTSTDFAANNGGTTERVGGDLILSDLVEPHLQYGGLFSNSGGPQSIAGDDAFYEIGFDTDIYDQGDGHDTSTNNERYVGPTNGVYNVTASININGALAYDDTVRVRIRKNGTVFVAEQSFAGAGGSGGDAVQIINVSGSINMDGSTDYVTVALRQDSGSAIDVVDSNTRLGVTLAYRT